MKKGKDLLRRILLMGIPALLLLASCVKEKAIVHRPVPGDDTEIAFSIMLPGKSGPASRAATRGLDENDENNVKDMDILVFEVDGTYSYTARCSGSNIVTDGSDSRKKTFTVKLRQGTFHLVLLANARDLTQGAFTGKNKQEVLNLLNSKVTDKWPADGSRPIPMWGEKENVLIDESTNLTGGNAVKLSRIVARVDVQIAGTANNFNLSSVYVYNYNTMGSIAPVPGSWDITTNPAAPRATVPNVPSSSILTKGPLLYEGAGVVTTTGCASEIYIFEAENHTSAGHITPITPKDLLDRTCLVIGGVYDENGDGDFTNDGPATYYRVDFSTGSGVGQSFLDVLRNHLYTFSVNKVSGIGYETAEIAFKSAPVNIEATVLEWNDGNVGDIYYNGNYYLSFDPGTELKPFYSDADEQTVNITTNFPAGWKIIKITDWDGTTETDITNTPGAWLTTDKTPNTDFGAGAVKVPVKVSVTLNTTNVQRTGYIVVKAGTMEVKMKVTQGDTSDIRVRIVDFTTKVELTELVFSSAVGVDPTPQSFIVNWAPKGADLIVTTTPISTYAFPTERITPSLVNVPGGTGTETYKVSPLALTAAETDPITGDPFMEKVSKVDFSTTNGISSERKSIFLRQINYNLLTDIAADYPLESQTETIKVRANFPWIITGVNDNDDILQNENSLIGKTGGGNTTPGDDLSFTMSPKTSDGSKDGKTARITITNLIDKKLRTITITAYEVLYVGYFGGELKETNGVWKFERKLYVQAKDAATKITWGPQTLVIPNGGASSVWDGKGNTFNLKANTYPAANLCFTKNANHASISSVSHADYVWYLPAQNQLMAAWGAHASFSLPFVSASYWSATEYATTYSWYVFFGSGFTTTGTKTSNYRVRCVREL